MNEVALGNKEKAKKLMGVTLTCPLNRQKFEALLRHADKVVSFWQMTQNKDYAKAYDLAATSAFFRKLPFYAQMQKRYAGLFKSALEIMLKGRGAVAAQEKLKPFLKVAQKSREIKAMLENPALFSELFALQEAKNYAGLAELFETAALLRVTSFYDEYKELMQEKINAFLALVAKGDYASAGAAMAELKEGFKINDPALKDEFKRLEIVENFNESVAQKKFALAMDLAATHTFLINASGRKKLDELVFREWSWRQNTR